MDPTRVATVTGVRCVTASDGYSRAPAWERGLPLHAITGQ